MDSSDFKTYSFTFLYGYTRTLLCYPQLFIVRNRTRHFSEHEFALAA